ncbi:hypothetical protein GQ457_07G001640 [Hibiscus cannabinus]
MGERGESSKNEFKGRKRITGHVETEDLWKMRRCLVGRMATVCSIRSIIEITSWGLGEIKVQRLGGKTFLISIDDEDLFSHVGGSSVVLPERNLCGYKHMKFGVGDMLHPVRVIELGFNDNSVDLNRGKNMVNHGEVKEKQRVNSDSESTSDPSEKMAPTVSPNGEGSERRSVDKDGSFIEPCLGMIMVKSSIPIMRQEVGWMRWISWVIVSRRFLCMKASIFLLKFRKRRMNRQNRQWIIGLKWVAFGPRC